MSRTRICSFVLALVVLLALTAPAIAQDEVTVNTGVDLYNRYLWRGLDIANTPSIQPALSIEYSGLEVGVWGAYTLSNEASESDEIDLWLSYTLELENGPTFTAIATDYYFPNAGISFFNYNDYDALYEDSIPDPGAHTIELGLAVTMPEAFPLTISGFVNIYNDAGNNAYFQADFPLVINGTDVNLFCGVTTGSEENPGYYGSDDLQAINVGVTASREVQVSETFSLPLSVSFIVNPNEEISHLVVGVSL